MKNRKEYQSWATSVIAATALITAVMAVMNVCSSDGCSSDDLAKIEQSQVGEPCTAGRGACQRYGVIRPSSDNPKTVECSAVSGAAEREASGDSIDNDCDGRVDESERPDLGDAAAQERSACESARRERGWPGSHGVSMDLACLDRMFGACESGWQVIIWDGLGCENPSNPGVGLLVVESNNDAPHNAVLVGARCGGPGTGREWRGPVGTTATSQCIISFLVNGNERASSGRICESHGDYLLPTFPASETGPPMSCP